MHLLVAPGHSRPISWIHAGQGQAPGAVGILTRLMPVALLITHLPLLSLNALAVVSVLLDFVNMWVCGDRWE